MDFFVKLLFCVVGGGLAVSQDPKCQVPKCLPAEMNIALPFKASSVNLTDQLEKNMRMFGVSLAT